MLTKRGIVIHTTDFDRDFLERVRAARLNVLGLHPRGGKRAHMSLEQAVLCHKLPEQTALRRYAQLIGIRIEYEAHALRYLLPEALFEYAPEWFRMNASGERTPDFNMCPSNDEALAYIAERAELLARQLDTGAHTYNLYMDDASNAHCMCPACRALSPSDQQLVVVNAMLMGLRRFDPLARLCYIAYLDAIEAPRRVQPLEGVFLVYAPIKRDHHAPINDPDNPKNASELRSMRELLACFGVKGAKVLDYWMDNSLFSNWTRPPKPFKLDAEVMKRDVEYYARLGFENITSFGCFLGDDYQALYGEPPIRAYGDILYGCGGVV